MSSDHSMPDELSAQQMMAAIPDISFSTRKLSGGYGKRIVIQDFTATFNPGITLLVGRNGAGKTTLIRLLAGELQIAQGEVILRDRTESNLPLNYVGHLPQRPSLPLHFTTFEFVRYAAWLAGFKRNDARDAANRAIEEVDLGGQASTKIAKLSGGMQQRVALAAVLVGDPRVLLFDEPMTALDPIQRESLTELLAQIAQTKPVIISTHVIDSMSAKADQIIVIDEGRNKFAGCPQALTGTSTVSVEALTTRVVELLRSPTEHEQGYEHDPGQGHGHEHESEHGHQHLQAHNHNGEA